MKKFLLLLHVFPFFLMSQVGVNTIFPIGVFHVDGGANNPSITPTVAQQADDFIITSAGAVGIGLTTPAFSLDMVGASIDAFRSTTYGAAPRFDYRRSGGSATTPANIANNDILANLRFFGYHTSFSQAATIKVEADAAPSATSMPGRLVFETTPATTVTPQERMRITNAGRVGIGSDNPAHKLMVKHDEDNAGVMSIDNATAGGFAGIYFYQNGSSNYRGHIGHVNTGGTSLFGGKGTMQMASGNRPLVFSASNGTELFNEVGRFNNANGNFSVVNLSGTGNRNIYADANGVLNVNPPAGQVLKMVMQNITGTSVLVNSTTYTTVASYTYNRVSNNSFLMIEFKTDYIIAGSGDDTYFSRIRIGTTNVSEAYQEWRDNRGSGTRSGTLFPIMGQFTNTATGSITIDIQAARGSSNDDGTFFRDLSTWIKVTEVSR